MTAMQPLYNFKDRINGLWGIAYGTPVETDTDAQVPVTPAVKTSNELRLCMGSSPK